MGQQIATWDASQLAMSFGNILIDGGFGENSIAKFEPEDTYWGVHKGGDGSITRYKKLTKVGKLTITHGQSSILNDLMSAQMQADHATPGGAGLSAFQLKDLNGTTLVTAAHAFIEGPPSAEWAPEVKEREWVIILMDAVPFYGGNPPQ